jgi:teichoic acid transport system permease protein
VSQVREVSPTEVQVYTPFRRGMPHLRPYLRSLWGRRAFAIELARAELRSQNASTGLGQMWLVLNPLLLTFVYYLLVSVLGGGHRGPAYLAHIMAGLFIFYYFSGVAIGGATSIVKSGKLIMNTPFPKMLLPLSVVIVNFIRFLPTLLIYVVVRLLSHLPFTWDMLWAVIPMVLLVIFSAGVAMLTATLNLYFRDTRSFLPYAMRIWLYLSPVLYLPADLMKHHELATLRFINPLFPLIGSWTEALVQGGPPDWSLYAAGAAWALGGLLVGGYFLLSREREFAVRI